MELENNIHLDENSLKRKESLEERIWIDSNISKIDELLRINYDKTVTEFTEIVLHAIADLMGSLRGAFYVVNNSTKKIEARAGYGCTLETMEKKEFDIGDDLIGFAVKSRKTRYIKNLPITNAVISSGLAKVSSSSLLISPLVFNDVVYGVIELNNLMEFDTKSLHAMDRLSRNIASTLQSIINNQRTKKLVKELQHKTNEMLAQEEELRQNMEELQTIKDEMEKQQKILEQNNAEMKAKELVLQKTLAENNEKNNELKAQEEELRQNMEELSASKDEMEKQHKIMEKTNIKLKANEDVLKKAIMKSREKEKELKEAKQRIKLLTSPTEKIENLKINDIFETQQLQQIQSTFANSLNLFSYILNGDKKQITTSCNNSPLFENDILKTEKGKKDFQQFEKELIDKIVEKKQFSDKFKDLFFFGGVAVFANNKLFGVWVVGQILDSEADKQKITDFAKQIGADEKSFNENIATINRKNTIEFNNILNLLRMFSNTISEASINNFAMAKELAKLKN